MNALSQNGIEVDRGAIPLAKARVGLWLFLAVVTILFSALVSAYVVRMGLEDWISVPEPLSLWLNTGLLILSSVSFGWAQLSTRRGQMNDVRRGLLIAGVLTVAFVIGQLLIWRQLNYLGYFVAANPANTFFYLITALHGLHLLGGLVAWGRTAVNVRRHVDVAKIRLSVELCALYWHFLLLVWLVLFGLMSFT